MEEGWKCERVDDKESCGCDESYYSKQGTCTRTCGTGFYPDSTTMTCIACTTGCTTCTGPGLDSCSECTTGYTLKSPSTCIKCSSSCLTCSDGSDTNCQQCAKDYFLDGFSCVSTCSGSQFGDADTAPDNPVCESCYHTCQRCTGDQHYMCLECKEGYYWDPMSNDCKP